MGLPPRLANFSAEDLLRSAPVPLTGGPLATSRYQPGSSQQTCDSRFALLHIVRPAPLTRALLRPLSSLLITGATPRGRPSHAPWVFKQPAPPPVKTTPPASKKHSTGIKPEFPLTKSKSHESELGNRVEPAGDAAGGGGEVVVK